MSFNDVESLIGPPLCYEEWTGHRRRWCFTDPTPVPLQLQQADLSLSYAEYARAL